MRRIVVFFLCSLLFLGSFGVPVDPLPNIGTAMHKMAHAEEGDSSTQLAQTTDTPQPINRFFYGSPQKGWYCSADTRLTPGQEYKFKANNGSAVMGLFVGFTRGTKYLYGPVYCKKVIYKPRLKKAPK